jgi:hypothetical protein
MGLLTRIKAELKRVWRFGYNLTRTVYRRITPEPVKKFVFKIRYWRAVKIIPKNQKILRQILGEKQIGRDYRTIIIFLPSLDWDVQLFQRPQQLAIALAEQGALVFYIQPKPDQNHEPFQLVRERLYLCEVHVDTFNILPNPLLYTLTWNSAYASRFDHPKLLYDYVDDINAFYGDHQEIANGHQFLLQNASYVLATARKLVDEVRLYRSDVIFSPNGVTYEHFARAAHREYSSAPSDMQPILSKSKPVIGYYGALARWFDYDLLISVASLRPEYQFVLLGPDYDGTLELSGILKYVNIHWLGVKPYEELPHYLQYFDVATIPFIVNEITHATSPIKLFEYMAGEKPIVITPMHESMHYPGVLVGGDADQFAQQLDLALQLKEDPTYLGNLRQIAQENTWEQRAKDILSAIEKEL